MKSLKVGDKIPVAYKFDGSVIRKYTDLTVDFVPQSDTIDYVWVKSGKARFTFGGVKGDAHVSFRNAQLHAMHKLTRTMRTHQDRANACREKLNAVMAMQDGV